MHFCIFISFHRQATYPSPKKVAMSILPASLKTSSRPVEAKSMHITSPGAQARYLQQKLASGQGITILRKVNNGPPNVKLKNLTPPNCAVATSGKLSPPHGQNTSFNVTSRSEYVPADATGKQTPMKTQGQGSLVKPKAVALKVTSSGIITPANAKLVKLATNYRISEQKCQLQLLEKPQHQSKNLNVDKQTKEQEQKYQNDDLNEQRVILPRSTKETIPLPPDRFKNVNLNQTVYTQKNHCILSPTTSEEKGVHGNHKLLNYSLSGLNNCPSRNTVKIVSAEHKPMMKIVIAQSFGVPTPSPRPQLKGNAVLTTVHPRKTVKFPVSSLFSLNLGNTGSLLEDKLIPRAMSPKVKSEMQQTPVKLNSMLQRKISPRCSTTKKDVNETYPSSDSDSDFSFGLNAMSVQNGLQRALSLTPFSSFLDDDVQNTDDTMVKIEKPTVQNEKMDFVRSQQIVDKQLARISRNIDKTKDILSNTKDDDTSEKKSNTLNKIPGETPKTTQQNIEKNTNHSSREGKVEVKSSFTATVMDDEDLKDALAPTAEESSKHKKVHSNMNDAKEDNSDEPVDGESFQMKVFEKVLRSILPTEALSPGDCLLKYGITDSYKTPTSKKNKDKSKKKRLTGDDETLKVRRQDKLVLNSQNHLTLCAVNSFNLVTMKFTLCLSLTHSSFP